MKSAARSDEKVFKSTGLGHDHRLRGDGLLGSALVHEDEVVHTAFFRNEDGSSEEPVAGFRRRRGYRR